MSRTSYRAHQVSQGNLDGIELRMFSLKWVTSKMPPPRRVYVVIWIVQAGAILTMVGWLLFVQRELPPIGGSEMRDAFQKNIVMALIGHPSENVDIAASEASVSQMRMLKKANLRNDLLIAVTNGRLEAGEVMLSRLAGTLEGIWLLKEFLRDEVLPLEARKHAAETLMRANTEDSVQAVVTTAIQEFQLGRPEVGGTILSTLHIPVGIEGAKGLLKSLFGEDSSATRSKTLPAEVQSTLRKALRSASDAEEIGRWLAQLYSDMQSSGQAANSNELLGGVAHPAMVGELAAQAQVQGKPQEVTSLFDRLIEMEDPGVFGAVARLASKQPSLLNEASEVMFNWSLEHPGQAQPGLFAEYLSNQALPPEQRVVAAYGLAGLIGKADARHALEKSISSEPDQNTRQYLHNALANLQNAELPESLKNSPVK